ncbi:4-alpha-glucanotransferase [Roseibium sp. MMSF_3544]|uniref:4-alpha-glucanotransferase n=1 Tax=unclassified Roseibium TaxID=2629323 RepID=UPI00274011A4|nr:4-alpha-glucanotransferase [Roseibium sp. MMSF_3544]
MSNDPLHQLAEAYGVLPMFHDLGGQERWTTDDTRRAMLKAMGVPADTDSDAQMSLEAMWAERDGHIVPPEYVVTSGYGAKIPASRSCEWILLDDAGQQVADGFAHDFVDLPALEVNVYRLRVKSGTIEQTALIPAAPVQTPSLAARVGQDRVWGVTAALYGLRSMCNLGLGDYSDLASLAQTIGAVGGSFLGVNPIHNLGWSHADIASPYSPSHRGFLNTIHIAVDDIPGLQGQDEAAVLIEKARAEIDRDVDLIDYPSIRARQHPLLRALFEIFKSASTEDVAARFSDFVDQGGDDLQRFAVFEALSVKHGENWHLWPDTLKDPNKLPHDAHDPNEAEFHAWLQWVATEQVDQVTNGKSLPLGLYLDLAVGARRDGAEAWMGQDSVAKGVSLGAPPDHLSPEGQNWQLTAFAPSLSAANGYRSLRTVLRQTMRSAGVIRIDHVLGLNRSFWIPDDGSPGAYIQQPFETLLALVGIEAHHAGCVVVGEDLGLVPDGFRDALAVRGIYGYSVLQYEKEADETFRDPSHLRGQSLACFATHDTPTLHGFCTGRDIDWWQRLGWLDADNADRLRHEREGAVAALVPEGEDPATAIHSRLANSPAAMTSVQLDDILGETEAQNLPGTTDEHPNWRRISAVSLEDLAGVSALNETASLMRNAGRAHFYPEGEN